MLTVGLTGSIAVGKTFVCTVLRDNGLHVLDADVTAREVVQPGTPGLRQIIDAFGADVLLPSGELDRKRLGSVVFNDSEKRKLLNSIVHPLVMAEQDEWIAGIAAADPHAIAVVDAALLIESGGYRRFNEIIVVWCDADIQLQRLMARDGLDADSARVRIAAQMPQDEKKAFADFLIDTTNGYDSARIQTLEIISRLRSIPHPQ